MDQHRSRLGGFTLVESVIVIVIAGILAGVVAVFIAKPVQGYVDTVRRTELTEAADGALRRTAREIHLALPNSIRLKSDAAGNTYLEYLLTRLGGRYIGNGTDDCFTGGNGCTSVTALGDFSSIATDSDRMVIYNLYANGGNDCTTVNPSVYCNNNGNANGNDNAAVVTVAAYDSATNQTSISFGKQVFLPANSTAPDGNRFQIVAGPVTYACIDAGTDANGDGTGRLVRYAGYAITPTQAVPPAKASSALLAAYVSACEIRYQEGVNELNGLVSFVLEVRRANEAVRLMHQVLVNNVP